MRNKQSLEERNNNVNSKLCPLIQIPNEDWDSDSRVLGDTFSQCIRNSGDSCASGLPTTQGGQVETQEQCYDYMERKARWSNPDTALFDFITFREFTNKDGDYDTECKSFLVADQKNPDEIKIIPDDKWAPDPRETALGSSAYARTKFVQSTLDRVGMAGGGPTYKPSGTASTENNFPDHVLSAFNNERGDYYNTDTYCNYPDDGILTYEQASAENKTDGSGAEPDADLLLNYCFSPETNKDQLRLGLDSAPKALSEARKSGEKAPRDICTEFFSQSQARKDMYDERAKSY